MIKRLCIPIGIMMVLGAPAFSQDGGYDEIIVTARKIERAPAIFIEKKGDFLLLDVRIINDSRERDERIRDLELTIVDVIKAAKSQTDITLSLVEDGFVRPLTQTAFMDSIRPGSLPDTSFANLKVKTDIPDNVDDAYKLVGMLDEFVEGLKGTGRTKITTYDDVAVSVINPYQYRAEVRNKVIGEMTSTLARLGTDYVVIPRGLDNNVRWVRSGDLNLKFYMDYTYQIYPQTLDVGVSIEDEGYDY